MLILSGLVRLYGHKATAAPAEAVAMGTLACAPVLPQTAPAERIAGRGLVAEGRVTGTRLVGGAVVPRGPGVNRHRQSAREEPRRTMTRFSRRLSLVVNDTLIFRHRRRAH